MLEVANIIKKMTKAKSDLVYMDLPKDDPTKRQPDISKAYQLLGWKPKISFEKGLKITIKWFKENLKQNGIKH